MLQGNIARLRKNRGLTQVEFAKQLHVTQSAVSHWESGRSVPDTVQLFRIAEFFNVSVDALGVANAAPVSQPVQVVVSKTETAPAPVQAQEKAPGSIDDQIMKELEGLEVDQLREVLNFIRFRKNGGSQ